MFWSILPIRLLFLFSSYTTNMGTEAFLREILLTELSRWRRHMTPWKFTETPLFVTESSAKNKITPSRLFGTLWVNCVDKFNSKRSEKVQGSLFLVPRLNLRSRSLWLIMSHAWASVWFYIQHVYSRVWIFTIPYSLYVFSTIHT